MFKHAIIFSQPGIVCENVNTVSAGALTNWLGTLDKMYVSPLYVAVWRSSWAHSIRLTELHLLRPLKSYEKLSFF